MTTDPNDDLMRKLRAADPVDASTLPAPNSQPAQSILEAAMADTGQETAPEMIEIMDEPVMDGPAVTHATLPQINRIRSQGRRRHWGVLAAAAAAVMILVAGVATFLPDNTPSALAAVQSAAAATANSDSGEITVSFWVEGSDGSISEQVAGDVNAVFNEADVAVAVDLTDRPSRFGVGLPSSVESRLVDGKLYVNDGKQWFVFDAPAGLTAKVVEFVDPRAVLSEVQNLLETEEIGSATIDGVETTHYRSIVDLGTTTLGESQWLPADMTHIDADGEVTVDLFVDDDGLLHQLVVSGDVREPVGSLAGDDEARFAVTTTFSNLGADLTVEAPADATSIDEVFGRGGFDFDFGFDD
jgi:hypothetical protein